METNTTIVGQRNRFTITALLLALFLSISSQGNAADFVLKDTQGKTHRLSDYRGKWVLVNFWATWCPPCLNEIPQLSSLHSAHKNKDLFVIGIAFQSGTPKQVTSFAKKQGINYPVVIGDTESIKQIGQLEVLPVSYLYNPKGEQVKYFMGEVTRESIEAYIKNK